MAEKKLLFYREDYQNQVKGYNLFRRMSHLICVKWEFSTQFYFIIEN